MSHKILIEGDHNVEYLFQSFENHFTCFLFKGLTIQCFLKIDLHDRQLVVDFIRNIYISERNIYIHSKKFEIDVIYIYVYRNNEFACVKCK